jgi:hypothetical protein
MIGGHWDISWHRSIGRDSFWTAPHIAIYLCGVLAGLSTGFVILETTFAGAAEAAAVRIWGFRGPLGAFVAAWGGIAMLTSAPFDDWWHAAYGLDVAILSPPHTVLLLGIMGVQLGTLTLVLGEMNREPPGTPRRRRLEAIFLYVGGLMLVGALLITLEFQDVSIMHTAIFYRVAAMAAPLVLAGVARASGRPFAATAVAGVYTALLLGFLWVLPLFPAEPKLGPVRNPVTHFIPPGFPLLVIVPALAMDLIFARAGNTNRWLVAALAGAAFVTVFVAAQWPFATFLMAPEARNAVFGSHYFDYLTIPHYRFWTHERTEIHFWSEMAGALGAAFLTTRLGIAWGDAMRKVRR